MPSHAAVRSICPVRAVLVGSAGTLRVVSLARVGDLRHHAACQREMAPSFRSALLPACSCRMRLLNLTARVHNVDSDATGDYLCSQQGLEAAAFSFENGKKAAPIASDAETRRTGNRSLPTPLSGQQRSKTACGAPDSYASDQDVAGHLAGRRIASGRRFHCQGLPIGELPFLKRACWHHANCNAAGRDATVAPKPEETPLSSSPSRRFADPLSELGHRAGP